MLLLLLLLTRRRGPRRPRRSEWPSYGGNTT